MAVRTRAPQRRARWNPVAASSGLYLLVWLPPVMNSRMESWYFSSPAGGSWMRSWWVQTIPCQVCDVSLMWWTVPASVVFDSTSDQANDGSSFLT